MFKILCFFFGCRPVELGNTGVIYCRWCKRIKHIGIEHFMPDCRCHIEGQTPEG